MEKNCFYCNRVIYNDELHYKFGDTYVCAQCGAIHTIRDVCNVVETDIRILPVTIEVSDTTGVVEPPEAVGTLETENSLSGKTESGDAPSIELDKSKIDAVQTYAKAPVIPEYFHDAENMSEEDYVSKYADNPDALDYWITANG